MIGTQRVAGQPLLVLVAIPVVWALLRIATMSDGQENDGIPSVAVARGRTVDVAIGRSSETPLSFERQQPVDFADGRLVGKTSVAAPEAGKMLKKAKDHTSAVAPQSPQATFERAADAARINPLLTERASRSAALGKVTSRWRVDAWLVLREGSEEVRNGTVSLPLYGASQAGFVLRFDLVPGLRHRPAAYLRWVHALGGTPEGDLAAGLAVRPFPDVPLTAHAEARASRRGSRVEVRPAVFAAGGFDHAQLPFGVQGRGYAQIGYVGGRDATAFADGSLVAERALLDGKADVSAGAGVWGGAQRGASRLDIGPSASLRFPLGKGSATLAVDYRLRIAGNAAPASGAALTLSAGF